MTSSANLRGIALFLCLLACSVCGACGSPSPPPPPPGPPAAAPIPRACEAAYEDLTKYYEADPERQRPRGLHAESFISTCKQLPDDAQSCILFTYMQAHPKQCDQALGRAPPELVNRLAAMAGK